MQPAGLQPDRPQLYALCGQFEQVLLASLLPESLFRTSRVDSADDQADTSVESGQSAAIFTHALSLAIERAGGLGLAREMYGALTHDRR